MGLKGKRLVRHTYFSAKIENEICVLKKGIPVLMAQNGIIYLAFSFLPAIAADQQWRVTRSYTLIPFPKLKQNYV